MIIKEFNGFEAVYPETIKGTKEWFCGQCTPCSEACEVRAYNGNYLGTRIYLLRVKIGEEYEYWNRNICKEQ